MATFDDELAALFPELDLSPTPTPAGRLADHPDHGGTTMDDFEKYAQEYFANRSPMISQPGHSAAPPKGGVEPDDPGFQPQQIPDPIQAPDPDEDEEDDDDETEDTPAPDTPDEPASPPDAPPDIIDLGNGLSISRNIVEGLYYFNEHVRNNPAMAREFSDLANKYLSPQAPQPETTPPPPEFDDPVSQRLWEEIQEQKQVIARQDQQLQSLQQGYSTHNNIIVDRQRSENEAVYNRAKNSFKTQYGLTDQQVNHLSDVAGKLGVLPSLMKGIDPITGATSKPDTLTALERALEIAYWSQPDMRERQLGTMLKGKVEESRKRKKLGALSPSGAGPRTSPAPRNADERKVAMLDTVREMMNGNFVSGES